jgi:peptidoglycan-associated lipoprotein
VSGDQHLSGRWWFQENENRRQIMKRERWLVWVIGISLLTFVAGCRKKAPVAAAPPAPKSAPAETAKPNPPVITEFTAEPKAIERGQSALLHWQVKDATQIEISPEIGAVTDSGRRQITPRDSTTYTLTAKGPGGNTSAGATLTVTLPPPPPPPATPPVIPTLTERLNKEVSDAFFDYDRSSLREDARTALTKDAAALKLILSDFPSTTLIIEGHCDERGSAEYNLGLGDRRASAAKDFLTQIGVPGDRLIKVSYGKEHPQCAEFTETCWQKNRRIHLAPGENQPPKATSELPMTRPENR